MGSVRDTLNNPAFPDAGRWLSETLAPHLLPVLVEEADLVCVGQLRAPRVVNNIARLVQLTRDAS